MRADLILRLVLAGALGGLIGAEREYRAKTAWMRTHILVAIGAVLMVIINGYPAGLMLIVSRRGFDGTGDPARVAAQIVSGIGFLGAGAIIVEHHSVNGPTTAAGIWVSAGIGMTVVSGLYAVSVAATILSLVGLEVLGWFFRNRKKTEREGSKNNGSAT